MKAKNKIEKLPDNLFNKIYNIKNSQSPEVINIEGNIIWLKLKIEKKKIDQ